MNSNFKFQTRNSKVNLLLLWSVIDANFLNIYSLAGIESDMVMTETVYFILIYVYNFETVAFEFFLSNYKYSDQTQVC